MMSDQQAVTVYSVQKRDASDDSFYPVGTFAIGPRGLLELKSAGEGFEDPLQNILQTVNAMSEFRIKVPSPPGSAPFSLDVRTVDRESPDVETAICDFLLQRYGLQLTRPEEEPEDIDFAPAAAPIPKPNWLVPPEE